MNSKHSLPARCYSKNLETGETIMIIAGHDGYYNVLDTMKHVDPDRLNATLGVTLAQRTAMEIGSMFGWHVPGANPERHARNLGLNNR